MSCAPGNVQGLKNSFCGKTTLAPAESAACSIPVKRRQLAGSLIGLSVTVTDCAPALKHKRVITETISGWVVAESIGGDANAALTFSSTRSPSLIKASMPPMDFRASASVSERLLPRTMLIRGPNRGIEKSGICRAVESAAGRLGPALS